MPTRAANDFISVEEADMKLRFGSSNSFVDYSSYSVAISPAGGERTSQSFPDLSGGKDTVTGVLSDVTLTITVVVNKAVDALYYLARTELQSQTNDAVDIEYSKKSPATGDLKFTSTGGKITACPPFAFDANSTARQEVQIVLTCPTLTLGVVA